MKIIFLFTILILSTSLSNAQKEGDKIILVKVNDTTNLFKRVKHSLINLDFIVKDLDSDTLKTYPREFLNNNFLTAHAIIDKNVVIISGIWGTRKLNVFGYSTSPKDYKPAMYYKGSIEWKLLNMVAENIGGKISYSR